MSDAIITVENLGKKYRLDHQVERRRYRALRDVLAEQAKRLAYAPFATRRAAGSATRAEEFWALKNVSFEVRRGEVLGIVGRNGAGKSTILKILSRITEPTTGRVRLRGRVASLLEVGTGFHPELTGRENVYLNGVILGMTHAEIQCKFDEIVAFAEVEQFLDTPIKRYSSGMYVRLAFAVAAHLEPEILIVDEVLAVGDAAFQRKCIGTMGAAANAGRTVIFVSHNMGAVTSLTQRALYLEAGSIHSYGTTPEIVSLYLKKSLEDRNTSGTGLASYRRKRRQAHVVSFKRITVNNIRSDALPTITMGEPFEVTCELHVQQRVNGAVLNLYLKTLQGDRIALFVSTDRGYQVFLDPGDHTISIRISGLPLAPGTYLADVGINPSMHALAYDAILNYPLFIVVNTGTVTYWPDRPWGVLHHSSVEWRVVPKHESTEGRALLTSR